VISCFTLNYQQAFLACFPSQPAAVWECKGNNSFSFCNTPNKKFFSFFQSLTSLKAAPETNFCQLCLPPAFLTSFNLDSLPEPGCKGNTVYTMFASTNAK